MQRQLDLVDSVQQARRRGHAGAQRAADKAERVVDPDWTKRAVEAIRVFASHQGALLFNMEICRITIELQGELPRPHELRAWGAATLIALRLGYIEATKTYHPAVSSNGAVRRCYRKGPKT